MTATSLRLAPRAIGPIGRNALIATALSLSLATQLVAQTGERVMEEKHVPKRYVYPIVGAAIGGLASLVYFWSGPRTLPGTCAGPSCVAIASLGGGALIGWLVGKEKDDIHELRYKGGRPLTPGAVSVDLTGEPSLVTSRDSLVAAVGGGGVQIFTMTSAKPHPLVNRAQGLRGVNDAMLLPGSSEIALSAAGGFYRLPMMSGLGAQLRTGPTSAVAMLGNDYVVGTGTRVERVAHTASDLGTYPGVEVRDTVRALLTDPRGVVWTLTSTELLALRPSGDAFSIVSRTAMPRGSQRVAIEGNLLAVAAGDSGVRFVAINDVEQPKYIADWRGLTRFSYDVALVGGKAYVASGIDGLAVVSLKNGTSPLQEGLARELGFVQSVTVSGLYLWVLENSGTPVLKRVLIKDLQ